MNTFSRLLLVGLCYVLNSFYFATAAWADSKTDVENACVKAVEGQLSKQKVDVGEFGKAVIQGTSIPGGSSVTFDCRYDEYTKNTWVSTTLSPIADEDAEARYDRATLPECKALVYKAVGDLNYTASMEYVDFQSVLTPPEFSLAVTGAELSRFIYACEDKCQSHNIKNQKWNAVIDSRDYVRSAIEQMNSSIEPYVTANSTPPVVMSKDPSGFHASVFRNNISQDVVIVFQGTDFTSMRDWATDLSQLFWKPEQYKFADSFTKYVLQTVCGVKPECHSQVVVAGHSLGGGLAQYVALQNGLRAFTFNAAGLGLWDKTTSGSTDAEITHFYSQGYRLGNPYGMELVRKTGTQASQVECKIPVDLPLWTWDSLTVAIATHSIAKLAIELSNLEDTINQPVINEFLAPIPSVIVEKYPSLSGSIVWFEDSFQVRSDDGRYMAYRRCMGAEKSRLCFLHLHDKQKNPPLELVVTQDILNGSGTLNYMPLVFDKDALYYWVPGGMYVRDLSNESGRKIIEDSWAAVVSPNHKFIAYMDSFNSGGPNLWILDLERNSKQQISSFPRRVPGSIHWLDNSSLLFGIGQENGRGYETWRIDRDGSNQTKLGEGQIFDHMKLK